MYCLAAVGTASIATGSYCVVKDSSDAKCANGIWYAHAHCAIGAVAACWTKLSGVAFRGCMTGHMLYAALVG